MELSEEEKNRLKRLNNDRNTLFALKKLFIQVYFDKPRTTQEYVKEIFRELNTISPDEIRIEDEDNLI